MSNIRNYIVSSGVLTAIVPYVVKTSENESSHFKPLSINIIPSKDVYDIISRDGDQLYIKYDSRTRNPRWVSERFVRESGPHGNMTSVTKRPNFFSENKIDQDNFRVWKIISLEFTPPIICLLKTKASHYRSSDYDKGHLAPAADFKHSKVQT